MQPEKSDIFQGQILPKDILYPRKTKNRMVEQEDTWEPPDPRVEMKKNTKQEAPSP